MLCAVSLEENRVVWADFWDKEKLTPSKPEIQASAWSGGSGSGYACSHPESGIWHGSNGNPEHQLALDFCQK